MRCLSSLLLVLVLPVQGWAAQVVGEARIEPDGPLRYSEHHACNPAGTRCTVEYRAADGEVFAHKWLDYSDSLRAPELRFEDWRSGTRVVVGDTAGDEVVVDAGFDHYVRERWPDLAAGEEVRFPFLVAGREEPLNMLAQRETECDEQRLCLQVSPANWLLSFLADPIRLVYDRETQRLLQFRGPSNIRDAGGRSQQVVIDYRYPDSRVE